MKVYVNQIICIVALSTFLLSTEIIAAQEPAAISLLPEKSDTVEVSKLLEEIALGVAALESAQTKLLVMLEHANRTGSSAKIQNQLRVLERDIDVKQSELENSKHQIERLNSILIARREDLVVGRGALSAALRELEEKTARKEELEELWQLKQEKMNSSFLAVDSMSNDLNELRHQINEVNQRAVEKQQSISVLEEQIEERGTPSVVFGTDAENVQDSLESEIYEVETRIQELETKSLAIQAKSILDGKGISDSGLLLDDAKEQLLGLTSELNRQKTVLVSKKSKLAAVQNEVTLLKKNGVSPETYSVDQQKFSSDLNSLLTTELKELESLAAEKQLEIKAVEQETFEVNERLDILLNKLNHLRASLQAAESNPSILDEQLEQKKEHLIKKQKKLDEVQSELSHLQEQIQQTTELDGQTAIQNEHDEMKKQLDTLNEQLLKTETLLEKERATAAQLAISTEDVRKEEASLEKGNYDLWDKIEWTKLKIDSLKKELRREQKKKEKGQDKLAKAVNSLEREKQVTARLKATELEQQAQIQQLADAIARSKEPHVSEPTKL